MKKDVCVYKIGNYLSGICSSGNPPFDKLELLEIIKKNSRNDITEDMFRLIDSKDFYTICLNKVKRHSESDFVSLVNQLNIPTNLKGEFSEFQKLVHWLKGL